MNIGQCQCCIVFQLKRTVTNTLSFNHFLYCWLKLWHIKTIIEYACIYMSQVLIVVPSANMVENEDYLYSSHTFACLFCLNKMILMMFLLTNPGQCGSYGVSCREKNLSESRLVDLLHGSEYVLTYEDKDGDWMLVGDVPWEYVYFLIYNS
jgi:hypothetical protein